MAMQAFTGIVMRGSQAIRRTGIILAAVASLASFATPAYARSQEDDETFPTDGDVATILGCLAVEAPDFKPSECIGQLSRACMEEDGNDTSLGMSTCLAREQNAWDVLLNLEYRAALERVEPAAATALRRAQRHWLRQVSLDLEVFSKGTGSIQLLNAAHYHMTTTAERVLFLRGLL